MSSESIIKTLQTMEFVRGLETHHLAKLATMAKEVKFSEGEMVFREGDAGDVLYLIKEGQIAVEIHVPGRGPTLILTVGPGQLLGWSSLFPMQRKTANGRVMVPTEAIALDAKALQEVCQSDHELGCFIAWRVAELIANRLKATRLQLLDIFAPLEQG